MFERELTLLLDTVRAGAFKCVATLLSHEEVLAIIGQISGKYYLAFSLLYSCSLRKAELLKSRIRNEAMIGHFISKVEYIYKRIQRSISYT